MSFIVLYYTKNTKYRTKHELHKLKMLFQDATKINQEKQLVCLEMNKYAKRDTEK